MGDTFSIRDLERAIEKYTSDSARVGISEWKTEKWLWRRLSWSGRFVSHLGLSKYTWWKETYILPILCSTGLDLLERYVQAAWTKTDGGLFRRCGSFFSSVVILYPTLFSERGKEFLAEECSVSFGPKGKNQEFLSDQSHGLERREPGTRNRPRISMADEEPLSEREVGVLVPVVERMTEATKHKVRALVDELLTTKKAVEEISADVTKLVQKAFPLRAEISEEMMRLEALQQEVFSLISSLDESLVNLSHIQVLSCSDVEARESIRRETGALKRCQQARAIIFPKIAQHKSWIESARGDLLNRLHSIVRAIDHLSVLEPVNPFYAHQSRIIRGLREHIKRFRLSLSKVPGPDQTIDQLEDIVSKGMALAVQFHEEGIDVARTKDRLYRLSAHVQELLTDIKNPEQSVVLHRILDEISGCGTKVELLTDRKKTVECLSQQVAEVEETIASHRSM